jgi:hypothetical protein
MPDFERRKLDGPLTDSEIILHTKYLHLTPEQYIEKFLHNPEEFIIND